MHTVLRLCLLLAASALFAACLPQANLNQGSFSLQNTDASDHKLLLSETEDCGLGLRTSVTHNTQTTFDVALNKPSYLCVGETPPPVKVEAGKAYSIQGGSVRVVAAP